ncbi:hypothetical protein QR77_09505, partial [Streptomyces sp. 150FB]|uniref:hypothetical protein n=1 Tax=Streptomyces sp. 150FB TaxID=1576605 RepID=UPI0005894DE4
MTNYPPPGYPVPGYPAPAQGPQNTAPQLDPNILIADPVKVTMGGRGDAPLPSQALVFSTADGQIVELARRPSAFGSVKYRYRYDVNMSDHLSTWDDQLPSGTGGFAFQAAYEARWAVTSAAEVVRRNIKTTVDGVRAVSYAVRDLLRAQAGLYSIEQLDQFEKYTRERFSGRPHEMVEGLTIQTLTVRLSLDQHAVEHLRALKQAQFATLEARAKHNTDVATHYLSEDLQGLRERAMLEAARGEGGLMLRLIGQDTSRLHELMLEFGNRHEVTVERKSQMLKELVDKGMIQPAEAQKMWEQMYNPPPLFETSQPALSGSTSAQGQLTAGAFSASDGTVAPEPQDSRQPTPPPQQQAQQQAP